MPRTEKLPYPKLLQSILTLIRREPLLRQRMLIGATAFGWDAVCALGAATAAIGFVAWLITEYAMTGRLPLGADTNA